MKAIEILYNLSPYQIFLEELYQSESQGNPEYTWTRSLKSQYNFIILELKYKKVGEYPQTAMEIKFEIKGEVVRMEQVYAEDPFKKEKTEQWIKGSKTMHDVRWHTEPNNTWYHDQATTAYLYAADEIAAAGANCTSGDHYHPGHFSTIAVTESGIALSQVNLHHAKSIDHKNDYHMRDLQFFIPLSPQEKQIKSIEDSYEIGEMSITFSDRSSSNNKACGKKIVARILQQQADFQK